MKREKYMIGNYVQIDNRKAWPKLKGIAMTVTGIAFRKDKVFPLSDYSISVEFEGNTYNQFDEFIQPIPLTESELVKLGFEKVGYDFMERNLNGVLVSLSHLTDDHYQTEIKLPDSKIWHLIDLQYVHELQQFCLINFKTELKYK